MRRLLTLVALAALVLWHPVAAADKPRLVVIVVVDQFRADYLTTFASHWRNGFKTLLAEGANFRRAQYPYLHTDTCAGHATISTGTFPHTHGMVADNWYLPEEKDEIECTEDVAAPAISYGLRTVMANSARHLLAPTLAEQLHTQQPNARVVTLSLKARGAILLAGHAGDAVTWFDENAGTFLTSRAYAPGPVPAVKRFIDASPYEKEVGSTWTLRDAPASYRGRDAGAGERPPAGWTSLFPHQLKGVKDADAQFWGQWRRSPFADAYLGRLAAALIDAYSLGQRDGTDFLGISFSVLDYVGHNFGPDSREVEDVAARLDDVLGGLIAHLDAKVGRANYVLALSADHGAAPIQSAANGTGRVAGEDVRERIEETLRDRYGAPASGSHVEWNYNGDIYLASAMRTRVAAEPATVRAIQIAAASIPGVERLVYTPALTERATDPLLRAAWLSNVTARNGDFVVVPKRGWGIFGRASANAAGHGSPWDYDQRVPVMLFGGGIRRGTFDVPASPADIAPTIAALAGIDMPKVEGRVLREALPPDAQPATR